MPPAAPPAVSAAADSSQQRQSASPSPSDPKPGASHVDPTPQPASLQTGKGPANAGDEPAGLHTPRDQSVPQDDQRHAAPAAPSSTTSSAAPSPSKLAVDADVDLTDVRHTPSMVRLEGARLWSAAANRYPQSAKAMYKAAMSLEPGERLQLARFPAGLDKQQGLVEAVRLHDGLAAPYIALGNMLGSKSETVRLPDGTAATRRELCLRAVGREPRNAVAWYSLGNTMSGAESVALVPVAETALAFAAAAGTAPPPEALPATVTKLDCMGRAISLDPMFVAPVKVAVGSTGHGRSVLLPDGTRLSKRELLLTLVALEPTAKAYLALSETVGMAERVALVDGSGATCSKKELLLRSIALDDTVAAPYHTLMPLLSAEEELPLDAPPSTHTVSKRTCCVKIIELDAAHSGIAYATLSGLLRPRDEPITLADGRRLTQRSASLAALKTDTGGGAGGAVSTGRGGSQPQGEAVHSRVSSDDDEPEVVEPYGE